MFFLIGLFLLSSGITPGGMSPSDQGRTAKKRRTFVRSEKQWRINQDYYLDKGPGTLRFVCFALEPPTGEQAEREEITVSKYGTVIVLDWSGSETAQLSYLRLMPDKVTEFFTFLEEEVKYRDIPGVPIPKNESYPLTIGAEYGLPSRSLHTVHISKEQLPKVEELIEVLEELQEAARNDPHTVQINTTDPEFLRRFMVVWHENEGIFLVEKEEP